jgi:uncharacterized membrane protein
MKFWPPWHNRRSKILDGGQRLTSSWNAELLGLPVDGFYDNLLFHISLFDEHVAGVLAKPSRQMRRSAFQDALKHPRTIVAYCLTLHVVDGEGSGGKNA